VLLLGVAVAPPAAGRLNGQGPARGTVDLSGTWSGDTMLSRGKDKFTLVLERTGESYAGTMSDAMGLMNQAPIGDAKYSDGTLRFSAMASLPNRNLQLQFTLRLEDRDA
jgi:hypothetical protein